jgi:dehydrogenase/reductase SDR family protein 7
MPACLSAGASQHALASETTSEVAQQLLDINTLAPIRLTQAVLPYMLKR